MEITKQIDKLMSGLKNGVGKSSFVGIIIQIIGICKIYNLENKEIFYLFQKVLFEAEFSENENHDYLAVYINQINNSKAGTFELEQFEQVMFCLIQTPVIKTEERKTQIETLNEKTPQDKCKGLSDKLPYLEPDGIDYEAIALADEAEFAMYEQEEDEAGDTGVLDESFWENQKQMTLAKNLQAEYGNYHETFETQIRVPYLIRENSGEEIPLNKEVFIIGKDAESADYVIYGNTTVSRRHAEIIKRGRHYFICDKGSTNKTYVEGKEIRPEEFVEIHNGIRIKISNEEFTFHL